MAGNDNFTKILLHMDGADGSTVFTDSNAGGSAHTWTPGGNAQIDTAQSKFGGSAGLFDGIGDWIRTPDSPDFTLGSGDFTCDFWCRFSTLTGQQNLCGQQGTSGATGTVTFTILKKDSASGVQPNTLQFRVNDGTGIIIVQGTTAMTTGVWRHIAAVRTGTTLKLFINGVQEGGNVLFPSTIPDSTGSFGVGVNGDFVPDGISNFGMRGWIDEFRLSVGIARWTANFTPPTSAYVGADWIGQARFAGASALSINAAAPKTAVANFTGVGLQRADAFKNLSVVARFAGSGTFRSDSLKTIAARATFAGVGSLLVDARGKVFNISVNFAGAGNLSPRAVQRNIGASRFAGVGLARLLAAQNGRQDVAGALTTHSTLSSSITVANTLFASISAQAATITASLGAQINVNGALGGAYVSAIPAVEVQDIRYSSVLHFDGIDGATSFTDSSSYTKTWLAGGSAQLDNAHIKFGSTSLKLDGASQVTGDASAEFAFGTGDFTIHFWFYATTLTTTPNLIDFRPVGLQGAYITIYILSGANTIRLFVNSSNQITGGTVVTLNGWHHVALTRSGTNTRLFLDGVQQGSTFSGDTTNYLVGANRPVLGADGNLNFGNRLIGWMDEVVLIKGLALWTGSSFRTPSLPTGQVRGRIHSLLHFEGTANSSVFSDSGMFSHTWTPDGINNALIDTTVAKFGGSSCHFLGTSLAGISGDASADFAFGIGDFTIDMWVRFDQIPPSELNIFWDTKGNGDATGTNRITLFLNTGSPAHIAFYTNGIFAITSTTNVIAGQFYHVALTRSGTSTRLFINGVQEGGTYTDTNNYDVGANRPRLGYAGDTNSLHLVGYLDEVRVVKGEALWTANFTPPIAPSTVGDLEAMSLLHFDGVSGSGNFPDSGTEQPPPIWSPGSATVISTTQSKFGGASVFFDGTVNSMLLADSSAVFDFGTGDFTIDFWVFRAVHTIGSFLLTWGPFSGTRNRLTFLVRASPDLRAVVQLNGGDNWVSTTQISAGSWYHIAFTRNQGVSRLFINGNEESTITDSNDYAPAADSYPRWSSNANSTFYFTDTGYIDEARFIKGQALWTASFTPPSTPTVPQDYFLSSDIIALLGSFKLGQFNWTGEGLMEFMPTIDFIADTLEDPETLLSYAAEIHVRSL